MTEHVLTVRVNTAADVEDPAKRDAIAKSLSRRILKAIARTTIDDVPGVEGARLTAAYVQFKSLVRRDGLATLDGILEVPK